MQEQDLVKALIKKVGRGKTLSRDLAREEAKTSMECLLRGDFTAAQAGAFLQAMRIKETTVDELVGASEGAATFRQGVPEAQPEARHLPLVVNLAFDTPRKGGVVALVALAWLKAAGVLRPMVVWEPPSLFPGFDSVSKTLDILASDPFLAGGLPEIVRVRDLCPAWEGLSSLRRELGFRTILNTVEKLLRPWETAPVVVGISHDTFSERLCHVLAALGAPRVAVVRGNHGTCDLNLGEKPTEVHLWRGGEVESISVPASESPWGTSATVLLASAFDAWPGWIADRESPLWGAVRGQAAFFHSVATGGTMSESVSLVRELPIR